MKFRQPTSLGRRFLALFLASIFFLTAPGFAANPEYQGTAEDRASLQKTGKAIRSAFASGDVDEIMRYHHQNVIKALRPGEYQVGREAVRAALVRTLQDYSLHFDESRIDSLFFQGKTAVEVSTFVIRGTPKAGGSPFIAKGRSMVVYVRYAKSPTGWASIREIIQNEP
jgi:ketosteroid isomerase-like protein